MISGPREARPSWLRRLVARAAARELAAFVVPGPEVARARGIDPGAAGLAIADTPRHASVLVVVGELPEGLRRAAAVAYAQMPRPRAVFAVGAENVSPLPGPDVSAALGQEDLEEGVVRLREMFAEGAFHPNAPEFDVPAIRSRTGYVCPMHPEVVREEPGQCPRCGMDLVPREAAAGEHGEGDGERDHEEAPSGEHGHAEHGAHDDMDHGGMGFMSMVEMTRDLPRSSDGLQMEWVEVPFGPLFPGLPAGLALTFTLDGDTVAEAEAERGIEGWAPLEGLSGPAETFADRLSGLDPLSPVAYRLLASRALENAAGVAPDERTGLARVGALERERAASHLNWLAGFGRLLGYSWLEERAGELQLALLWSAGPEEVARLAGEAGELARRVEWTPLLRRRLGGIGTLPAGAEASGPVARAGGSAADARRDEEAYRRLGFEPVVLRGNDALSRLRVRLAEIEQSLDLVSRAGSVSTPVVAPGGGSSGTGAATVETPRGLATLNLILEGGAVVAFEIGTPSARHLKLVKPVSEQREVADALVGIASLDLSPWEVVR